MGRQFSEGFIVVTHAGKLHKSDKVISGYKSWIKKQDVCFFILLYFFYVLLSSDGFYFFFLFFLNGGIKEQKKTRAKTQKVFIMNSR